MGASILTLPARLTTSEVCSLARYGATTLWRERRAGNMPAPIARGREDIYDRDAVLKALGMIQDENPTSDEWDVDPLAIRDARARKVRDAAPAQGRHLSGVLPGSRKAATLRVVVADPAPAGRRA